MDIGIPMVFRKYGGVQNLHLFPRAHRTYHWGVIVTLLTSPLFVVQNGLLIPVVPPATNLTRCMVEVMNGYGLEVDLACVG